MRFVGIVLLIGLVAGCSPKQPVPVRIGYVETDVPSSSQCVEITGAFQGRPYQLRMAYSQNGKVSYKILNETPCIMQDTVLTSTVWQSSQSTNIRHVLRLECSISLQITRRIETGRCLHCILLETYPDRPFSTSDTIPLTSYTSGAFARNTGRTENYYRAAAIAMYGMPNCRRKSGIRLLI